MKRKLVALLLTINFGCNAQDNEKNSLNSEKISFKNVCFNGVCLRDSIERVIGKYGKPDNIILINTIDQVDGMEFSFYKYRYYYKKNKDKYFDFIEERKHNKGVVFSFRNVGNTNFYFEIGDGRTIIIGSDTLQIKNEFPNRYRDEVESTLARYKKRKNNIEDELIKIENDKKAKSDTILLQKRIKKLKIELNDFEKEKNIALNINVDIVNNPYGYYGLIFHYINGRLEYITTYMECAIP